MNVIIGTFVVLVVIIGVRGYVDVKDWFARDSVKRARRGL